MDPAVLKRFNLAAYAGGAAYERLPDGRRHLVLEEGIWRYEDEFSGSDPYIGSTMLWREGKPCWRMGYCGRCVSDLGPDALYAELREALRNPDERFPVRGRGGFITANGFFYGLRWDGDLSFFSGEERLVLKSRIHYIGLFHGTRLQDGTQNL